MSTAQERETPEDFFREAIRAWNLSIDTAMKMQEEYTKRLREMLCEDRSLTDWYAKTQAAVCETIAKSQESIEEACRLINRQAESGAKLVQKALDARPGESAGGMRERFVDWWESALEAMQSNAQAVLQANTRFLSTWADLARNVNAETAEKMAQMAKRTSEQAEKMTKTATERIREVVRQASENGT